MLGTTFPHATTLFWMQAFGAVTIAIFVLWRHWRAYFRLTGRPRRGMVWYLYFPFLFGLGIVVLYQRLHQVILPVKDSETTKLIDERGRPISRTRNYLKLRMIHLSSHLRSSIGVPQSQSKSDLSSLSTI
jgi:hypothetical protein